MSVRCLNACLLSTLSIANKQIIVVLGPHTDNLCSVNFSSGTVELRKRKKILFSHPIAFEELGREQFTLDYLKADKLAAAELLGSQELEFSLQPD